ncbi:MAG: ABC transporter permease [Bacteroidetes bacterium]|nr:ABC transporter permease [Bacteroidota bacterium]
MNIHDYTLRSLWRYKPFYRLIAIAVTVAVAVITGSLAVGDSVRGTLIKKVEERLGKTETIIFARYAYLDNTILEHIDGVGILLSNGFVSVSGRLIPVMVWGRDDMGITKGNAKINSALFSEIKTTQPHNIVLRLPAAGMVPLGSLYVTDTYTTSLRLTLDSVLPVEEGGNINLKNEQTIPFNIFVNRDELAETIDTPGKINLILSDQIISSADFASVWNYTQSGLRLHLIDQAVAIASDRIFIQDKVVETLYSQDAANRIYSYLANSIAKHDHTRLLSNHCIPTRSIPYSFITAVDDYDGQPVRPNEIILSDYAAKRLQAHVNDTLSLTYFVSQQFKTLTVDSLTLKVGKIVPLNDLQADNTLKADFPGLSNAARCTDWDSDLPIDMRLITDEDEAYWTQYRNTPKALVPYATLAPRWKNAYGSATALHLKDTSSLHDLSCEMFDISLLYPREAGFSAAQSGVDFSILFLSLGIFIILSAAILMIIPISEMLFRRRHEISILQATGFPKRRIIQLLWRESVPAVFSSALVGVIIGLIYTYLVLFLLGTVWKGATHTDGFRLYPNLMTIGAGITVGILSSGALLYVQIVHAFKGKPSKNRLRKASLKPFNTSRVLLASLSFNRKQALRSFVALASGVLIVYSVGLNRRGFADTSQMRTATGGFSLWCETSVPIYHDAQTEEGRAKLALKELPKDVQILQLLKYSADDASCLNLNKVVTPNVLGIDREAFLSAGFQITKTIDNNDDLAYPAYVDETVLQWSLGKKLGDTLIYQGEKGQRINIRLTGTIKNSIFQGAILIDKHLFSEIWSEISGSELMLVKVPDKQITETKMLISQALNQYGVRIMTTGERLQLFYSVTDTYLTIFMTLGGLGLLLGIFSFIIVVRKNLAARNSDINLYQSLGFNKQRIEKIIYKENIIIPVFAIAIGALGSLGGVGLGFGNVGWQTWGLALFLLIILVLCTVGFVKSVVINYLQQGIGM